MAPKGFHDPTMRRKLGQDHKRELDQKHKWARGEASPTRGCDKKTPAKAAPRQNETGRNKMARMETLSRKHESRLETDTSISDSSAEEEVRESSAAPEPDAGITYSYDAAHGPNQGGQILSMALAKAVERYETQATEKLVMEEYEVVGMEKEDASTGYAADDGDFELI
ncbi:MAG: hypothetical protein LQ349_005614 [Xanthoria aureola]|nr:MAG: hypothetical protein LQ349_005614 [Xanthoria aureola]